MFESIKNLLEELVDRGLFEFKWNDGKQEEEYELTEKGKKILEDRFDDCKPIWN